MNRKYQTQEINRKLTNIKNKTITKSKKPNTNPCRNSENLKNQN